MALRYVAIEKEAPFQGKTESWANVYLYETDASDEPSYAALAQAIVGFERGCHSLTVVFRTARIFTTSGLNGVDDFGGIYHIEDLAGALGTMNVNQLMYRECAVLVKWPLPRKTSLMGLVTGRQRSLKKWYRSCGLASVGLAQIEGSSVLSAGSVAPFANAAIGLENPVPGSLLVAPDGEPPASGAEVHPYLEHRQFPRGRKES